MLEKELLIIGGNGFIGRETSLYLKDQGVEVISPSSSEVDITDEVQVDNFIKNCTAGSVLLSAAYTDVKGAQTTEGNAFAIDVNVIGTKIIADACRRYNKHLIYISTDFVFDGSEENTGTYKVDAKLAEPGSNLIGGYARSKVRAEKILEEYNNVAIVRISYPFYDVDSVKDYVNKLKLMVDKGYGIVTDQTITPTYVIDLVQAIEIILERKLTGKFHVATYPPTTPHEFISYYLERDGIKKGSLRELIQKGAVPVPINGGLDIEESQESLIQFHEWKHALDEVKSS